MSKRNPPADPRNVRFLSRTAQGTAILALWPNYGNAQRLMVYWKPRGTDRVTSLAHINGHSMVTLALPEGNVYMESFSDVAADVAFDVITSADMIVSVPLRTAKWVGMQVHARQRVPDATRLREMIAAPLVPTVISLEDSKISVSGLEDEANG